jgi:small subunit ribosomal protein S20
VANTPTAKKMILVHEKRRKRNVSVRTQIKNTFRKVTEAMASGEGIVEAATRATSCIDKAAAKGIVHKNKAARRKSRLARKVNAAQA